MSEPHKQLGVSEATFYNWKKKYAHLGVSGLRELRQLRDENGRLKRLVADLTLDKQILSGVVKKKALQPARRRELVAWIHDTYATSTRRACELAQFPRAGWYRKSTARDQAPLRRRTREIALTRPRFGYQRIHVMLRREGWTMNHKWVHRLYRLDGLPLRMRVRRRKHMALHRGVPPKPVGPGERLSMDFLHDQLFFGRRFRILAVVDQWSRESVLLEARFSFSGAAVANCLEGWINERPAPTSITVDHGTEFTSKALEAWAWQHGVTLDFMHPGKPMDNGYIESINGRLRDECLNVNQFDSLEHAQQILDAWRDDYDRHRPRGSLGQMTPLEFRQRHHGRGSLDAT